jgi:VIT1/CCC1 family predicted Fe2+/Mn2+ transporter
MFGSFLVIGFVPLVAYVLNLSSAFTVSIVLSAAVLFTIGALRSLFSPLRWGRAGLELEICAAIGAGAAYLLGHVLATVVR